jgi:16S rRNA (adenine1518-N6/adenine1519-N6)-dimethyltransferase
MVRPKKHLGQHFLHDENIARKIISFIPDQPINLLEIGPGTGMLSKYLLQNEKLNPFFLEIDTDSVNLLLKNYPGISGRLIHADILDYDLSDIPSPFTMIGNFPYNISSQILFRVIRYRNIIPEVIGMFQKEVAERISSTPGTKKYGIISVMVQAYYHTEYLFTVSEKVFFPQPRVKSAVIRLKRNETEKLDCDEDLFLKVVKTAFNQRRKTLRNALKSLNVKPTEYTASLMDLRAEQLSVTDFVLLTKATE